MKNMTFFNCSRCAERIHLRVTSAQENIDLNTKQQLCFACFKKLDQFDVVEIISTNDDTPEAQIGDKATVLDIYGDNEAFEIECVLKDGTNKWMGAFNRNQIKAIL